MKIDTPAIHAGNKKEKKLSRWWWLYHFWTGACLKVYIDVSGLLKYDSGLFKYIPGNTSDLDHLSAESYYTIVTILVVGTVALGCVLSKSLIKAIDGSKMANKVKIFLKCILPIVYFVSAALLGGATAPLFAASQGVQKTFTPSHQQTDIKPVMVYTTTQLSDLLPADLDQTWLSLLETWLVETMRQKGRNKYAEMGYNPKDFKPRISASSVYFIAGGRKLAIIKINMNNFMRVITIIGIKDSELQKVNCIRASNHDIPVWSGICGDEVKKTFGVSIQL